ncbi:MAG: DUF4383 domain-containing protein [Solirubrobacterales bacterium]
MLYVLIGALGLVLGAKLASARVFAVLAFAVFFLLALAGVATEEILGLFPGDPANSVLQAIVAVSAMMIAMAPDFASGEDDGDDRTSWTSLNEANDQRERSNQP